MARLMVGRMSKLYPKPATASDRVVALGRARLRPRLRRGGSFALIARFSGFGGLIGAGRTELFEGLVGLRSFRGQSPSTGGR